jgi:hypothetical protein
MIFSRYYLSVVILLYTNVCLAKSACDQSGKDIMAKQNQKQSANSEEEIQQIIILDIKTQKKKNRKLKRFMMKKGDDKKSVLYFYEPADINGSGLLSWQKSASENQWLYIPALKKLQRIASGSKKNYFMGTDFTYADLDGEVLDKSNYKCLKMTSCKDKSACYIIEAKPINDERSRQIGYTKRLLLVNKKRLTTEKIIFYNLKGAKLKTAEYLEWQKIGSLWRPNLAMMDRHKVQKTYIKIVSRKINTTIDPIKFSKRFLKKEMHMK